MSEEVRSRCHVKHTVPRWTTESTTEAIEVAQSGSQNVRRQKSWDMLDQSSLTFARQHQHKVQTQVNKDLIRPQTFTFIINSSVEV